MADNKVLPGAGKRRLPPNAGKGRVKGVPNKATQAAREAIGLFVDNNAHRLQGWLDAIGKTDPEKAFTLFQSVIEYHVPKLARQEHTGKDGGAIIVQAGPADEGL